MADGRRVPIEMLAPGDVVRSLAILGMKVDVPFDAQYEWLSTWGLEGAAVRPGRIAHLRLGEHEGFYLINGRIKATFEHPFLVRRGDQWGFCSAERLEVGDRLIAAEGDSQVEERLHSIEHIAGRVRTVMLYIPGTNTFLADGAWTHNSSSGFITHNSPTSGSSSSGSGSGKSSGSSFSGPDIATSGSSNQSSGSISANSSSQSVGN